MSQLGLYTISAHPNIHPPTGGATLLPITQEREKRGLGYLFSDHSLPPTFAYPHPLTKQSIYDHCQDLSTENPHTHALPRPNSFASCHCPTPRPNPSIPIRIMCPLCTDRIFRTHTRRKPPARSLARRHTWHVCAYPFSLTHVLGRPYVNDNRGDHYHHHLLFPKNQNTNGLRTRRVLSTIPPTVRQNKQQNSRQISIRAATITAHTHAKHFPAF